MRSTGTVDYGSASIDSRHTVHRNTAEFDARTGNRLLTIPAGDTASVRLGNWNYGTEGEAIEYLFIPSATDGDMLVLKYAVVLANPNSGHTAAQKPGFTLQILDSEGNQVSGQAGCYDANFTAGENATEATGWYSNNYTFTNGDKRGQYTEVLWKDWTTVFFPLHDYVGQPLRIRLITKDCLHVSHFGYAYFTMHCQGAKLEGIACGDSNTHFEAPLGYSYHWYKKSNPNERLYNTDGTRKTVNSYAFDINPGDTAVYCVDVYSGTGCSITLEADPNVQVPQARIYEVNRVSADCHHTITFADTSFVSVFKGGEEYRSSIAADPTNAVIWQWGDGTPEISDMSPSVSHRYEPGDYEMQAIVRIAGGCDDTVKVQLHLPEFELNILDRDTMTICEGESVRFHGQLFTEAGDDTVSISDGIGCPDLYLLHLNVKPLLRVEAQPEYVICPEEPLRIAFRVVGGEFDSLVVTSSAEARNAGFAPDYVFRPEDAADGTLTIALPGMGGGIDDLLKAGDYSFRLQPFSRYPECGQPTASQIRLRVNYPAGSVVQRGSYLFLYDESHNGGYDWTGSSYQWYCNGTPISGKTGSQLLMPETAAGTEYYCVITDAQGHSLQTCPIVCETPGFSALEDVETGSKAIWLRPGQTILMEGLGSASLYDVAGRLLRRFGGDETTAVEAPATAGMYLLKAGDTAIRILVR